MPIRSLRLGFYGEGNTDDRFLPPLVERTVRGILNSRGRYEIDVAEPLVVSRSKLNHFVSCEERILQAATETAGYDALIVHLDADAPDARKALRERFDPALKRVNETKERVCSRVVPIIPVRMSEAWMIADWETLVALLNPTLKLDELRLSKDINLPGKPHESESNLDPKQTLKQIVAFSQQHRRRARREVPLKDLQPQLGRSVRLEVLNQVPAFDQFVQDMTEALISLGVAK